MLCPTSNFLGSKVTKKQVWVKRYKSKCNKTNVKFYVSAKSYFTLNKSAAMQLPTIKSLSLQQNANFFHLTFFIFA